MTSEASDGAAAHADGRRRSVRVALAAAIIAATAAFAFVVSRGTAAPSPSYSTAPASWSLPALTGGGTVRLSDFRGKPLVLDFFASWCTACRAELPEFLAVDRRMGGRVQFAAVDSEENGDGLALARQSGITAWRLARDVGGSQQSGLREALESLPGMPITAFYDSSGRVLQVRLGALNADALSSAISRLYPAATP
jgi:thiol-disulfide isomerase/thioredoxin